MKDYLANHPDVMAEVDAKIREKVLALNTDEDGVINN